MSVFADIPGLGVWVWVWVAVEEGHGVGISKISMVEKPNTQNIMQQFVHVANVIYM